MAPGAPWRCCFRPQVAEGSAGGEQIVRAAPTSKGGEQVAQDKCIEDSANAEIFSRLQIRPIRTGDVDGDDFEEFASPASSYQTCFSEQDPTDLADVIRISRSNSISSSAEEVSASLTAVSITGTGAAAAAADDRKGGEPSGTTGKTGKTPQPEVSAVPKQQQSPFHQPWMDTELGRAPPRRRDTLPRHNHPLPSVNIWSLIRDWIGKDIHKLVLPTHLNEPLTELQRRAEAYEASHLLDAAALMPKRSLERHLQIVAFATSMYNTVKRVQKPFKNLQNSTYELVYPEKRVRLVGEKCGHIPVKHVMHAEGAGWEFDGNDIFNMDLWGNYAIIKPHGELYIKFHDGDEYCWNTVATYINNILIGKRYLDHRGSYHITQLATGNYFQCKISEPIFGKSQHAMNGHLVKNGKKVEDMTVSGKWDEAVFAHFPDGTTKELWRALPPYAPMQNTIHPFSLWAVHMNELTPELRAKLPPTDDRLRPDMRLFEHGLFEEANDEKLRLEEKQRQERQAAEAAGKSFGDPIWFYKVPGGRRGYETWRYKGGYWEAREKGDWSMCSRDPYGPGPKAMKPAELLY